MLEEEEEEERGKSGEEEDREIAKGEGRESEGGMGGLRVDAYIQAARR